MVDGTEGKPVGPAAAKVGYVNVLKKKKGTQTSQWTTAVSNSSSEVIKVKNIIIMIHSRY